MREIPHHRDYKPRMHSKLMTKCQIEKEEDNNTPDPESTAEGLREHQSEGKIRDIVLRL